MTEALQTRQRTRRPATLGAFDSACSTTEIGKVVVGNQLAQTRDIKRLSGEVALGANANQEKVAELSDGVNKVVYKAFERMYGLTPEGQRPVEFFQKHMQIADRTVQFLAEQVNPNDPTLQKKAPEFETPADVIKHLSSPDTDPESRRAVTTRLAFALTSAEQGQYFEGTEKVIEKVDDMISTNIITSPRKSGMVYTIHHNETNALDRAAQSLDDLFAEPINEEYHVKEHDLKGDFQHIGLTDDSDLGLIAVRSRVKSENTALLKTVRAAILRTEGEQVSGEDREKGDNLIASDTKDFMGSTYVVLSAKDSSDTRVTTLREKVKAQYQEMYPNLTDEDFVEDSKTNNRSDSVDFTFQRMLVNNIPDTNGYFEVMFFGQDYFDYKYAVGNTDPDTGKPDGCAHALYEGTRFFKTYTTIAQPENPAELERSMYAERSEQLRNDNKVDIDDLMKKYEEEREFLKGGDIFNASQFGSIAYTV